MDFRLSQLRFASIAGNEVLVQSLLDSLESDKLLTADIFLDKDSPLILAMLASHIGTVRLLLLKACSSSSSSVIINYQIAQQNNVTCLEWSCINNQLELCQLFVELISSLPQTNKLEIVVSHAFALAFENDHLDICDMFLDKFQLKQIKCHLPSTLLLTVCQAGKLSSITFLIDREIVSKPSIYRAESIYVVEGKIKRRVSLTPLDIAVEYDHMGVFAYLLLTVSRVTFGTALTLNFFLLACKYHMLTVFEELLPKITTAMCTALTVERYDLAKSAFQSACHHHNDNLQIVETMLELNLPFMSLFHLKCAVESDNITILDLVLRHGGKRILQEAAAELTTAPTNDINCQDNPMVSIAINGRVDMAQMLLQQAGASQLSFAAGGTEDRTPLAIACDHGHYDIAKLLTGIKYGPYEVEFVPFQRDQMSTSAGVKLYLSIIAEMGMSMVFHTSSFSSNIQYMDMQQVIESEAWLHEADSLLPWTNRHIMSTVRVDTVAKRMENLRVYLQEGLSFDCLLKSYQANQQFLTAREKFAENNLDLIMSLIDIGLVSQTEINQMLLSTCAIGRVELARDLLRCGAKFIMCPELNSAIQSNEGGDATIDLLLEQPGFDVNSVDTVNPPPVGGQTLLKWVCLARLLPSAKRLIAAGANVNYQDELGRTALHWLVATSTSLDGTDKKKLDVIALLLENGANNRIRDKAGLSVQMMIMKQDRFHASRNRIDKMLEAGEKEQRDDVNLLQGVQGLSLQAPATEKSEEVQPIPRRKVKSSLKKTTNPLK